MIELENHQEVKDIIPMASIKVVGIGGAGGNTVNSIIDTCKDSIEYIVANTDAQALELSRASKTIQLGIKSTRGLGTGADPELGKRAAEEDIDKVIELVKDADIVFLTAGMGGGTGSGALPVIARTLREHGILTIAIVTKPFEFEGKKRKQIAEKAIEQLKQEVDTLIIVPNQKLLEVVDEQMPMIDSFALINTMLGQSVKGISDIITKPGYINVDFADVRNIMKGQGLAVMGTARASGVLRAQEAAEKAISSPLLENMSIAGAHSVLLNITGGPSLGLQEISQAAQIIYEQVDENAQIIIGSVIDENMKDEIAITIIATGFAQKTEPMVSKPAVIDQEAKQANQAPKLCRTEETALHALPASDNLYEPSELKVVSNVKHADATVVKKERVEAKAVEVEQEEPMFSDMHDLDVPTFLREQEQQDQ